MEDLLQVATWGLAAIRNLNLPQRLKIFSLVLARKKLLLQPLTYMFDPPKSFRNKFRILSTHGLPSLYSALSCTGKVPLPQDYYRSLWFGVEFFCNMFSKCITQLKLRFLLYLPTYILNFYSQKSQLTTCCTTLVVSCEIKRIF